MPRPAPIGQRPNFTCSTLTHQDLSDLSDSSSKSEMLLISSSILMSSSLRSDSTEVRTRIALHSYSDRSGRLCPSRSLPLCIGSTVQHMASRTIVEEATVSPNFTSELFICVDRFLNYLTLPCLGFAIRLKQSMLKCPALVAIFGAHGSGLAQICRGRVIISSGRGWTIKVALTSGHGTVVADPPTPCWFAGISTLRGFASIMNSSERIPKTDPGRLAGNDDLHMATVLPTSTK